MIDKQIHIFDTALTDISVVTQKFVICCVGMVDIVDQQIVKCGSNIKHLSNVKTSGKRWLYIDDYPHKSKATACPWEAQCAVICMAIKHDDKHGFSRGVMWNIP